MVGPIIKKKKQCKRAEEEYECRHWQIRAEGKRRVSTESVSERSEENKL